MPLPSSELDFAVVSLGGQASLLPVDPLVPTSIEYCGSLSFKDTVSVSEAYGQKGQLQGMSPF